MLDSDGSGGWRAGATGALPLKTLARGRRHRRHACRQRYDHALERPPRPTPGRPGSPSSRCRTDFDPGLVLLFDRQGPGRGGLPERRRRPVGRREHRRSWRPGGAGKHEQSVRVRRLLRRRRCRARLARGLDRRDRGRRQQRARRGAHAPGRREFPQLTFYRVDDYSGTIDGKAPGHADYAGSAGGRQPDTEAQRHLGPGDRQFSRSCGRASTPTTSSPCAWSTSAPAPSMGGRVRQREGQLRAGSAHDQQGLEPGAGMTPMAGAATTTTS